MQFILSKSCFITITLVTQIKLKLSSFPKFDSFCVSLTKGESSSLSLGYPRRTGPAAPMTSDALSICPLSAGLCLRLVFSDHF